MFRTVLFVSLLGALVAFIFKIMLMLDINKTVYNHRPGACRKIDGVKNGAEDITLLGEEGIAIVTSGIVYLTPRKKEVKGQLFLYDFHQEDTYKVETLKINGKYDRENFHPHGISHVITATGARLFVLKIVFSKDFKSWEITEPFADDGRLISASSIAVPYGNQLLIGSVCRELLHCDISPETV
ncbi:hypothetical protein GCK32_003783 [Trichostrongylus colubriformis]|uniref:Uncharacterized protein n=1 Tax=Trichostrongylus colubriformis TaxID=6319 RepID=A0AAN8FRH6_TRICO